MEHVEIQQKLYREFQELRIDLYQAIAEQQLSYDWLHTFDGDARQMLERVEEEMLAAKQREAQP